MPPNHPNLRGLRDPCSYSQLFFTNQLPTLNFIESPEKSFSLRLKDIRVGYFNFITKVIEILRAFKGD